MLCGEKQRYKSLSVKKKPPVIFMGNTHCILSPLYRILLLSFCSLSELLNLRNRLPSFFSLHYPWHPGFCHARFKKIGLSKVTNEVFIARSSILILRFSDAFNTTGCCFLETYNNLVSITLHILSLSLPNIICLPP